MTDPYITHGAMAGVGPRWAWANIDYDKLRRYFTMTQAEYAAWRDTRQYVPTEDESRRQARGMLNTVQDDDDDIEWLDESDDDDIDLWTDFGRAQAHLRAIGARLADLHYQPNPLFAAIQRHAAGQ